MTPNFYRVLNRKNHRKETNKLRDTLKGHTLGLTTGLKRNTYGSHYGTHYGTHYGSHTRHTPNHTPHHHHHHHPLPPFPPWRRAVWNAESLIHCQTKRNQPPLDSGAPSSPPTDSGANRNHQRQRIHTNTPATRQRRTPPKGRKTNATQESGTPSKTRHTSQARVDKPKPSKGDKPANHGPKYRAAHQRTQRETQTRSDRTNARTTRLSECSQDRW